VTYVLDLSSLSSIKLGSLDQMNVDFCEYWSITVVVIHVQGLKNPLARPPGQVIYKFGLAEIISCMPDGLKKLEIVVPGSGIRYFIFKIFGKPSFVEAMTSYAVFLPSSYYIFLALQWPELWKISENKMQYQIWKER
jgi:hypothetical protein